jgi:hypothetical protein
MARPAGQVNAGRVGAGLPGDFPLHRHHLAVLLSHLCKNTA